MLHRELVRRGLKGIKSAAAVLRHPTVGGLAGLVAQGAQPMVAAGHDSDHEEASCLGDSVAARIAQMLDMQCIGVETELSLSVGQLKQLSLTLGQQLDVWALPEQLAALRTASAIAEHVEGEAQATWMLACLCY